MAALEFAEGFSLALQAAQATASTETATLLNFTVRSRDKVRTAGMGILLRPCSDRQTPSHPISLDAFPVRVLEYCHGQAIKESNVEIKRAGTQPSGRGQQDWFTGPVRIDPLFQAGDPARVVGASVTFEPGARTAWHTHPLGQTLIVTFGRGFAQRWGGPIEEIRPGDVVWFEPGEKHWHGATHTTALVHIAIQESKDGRAVDWLEKVSDEQYGSAR